MASYLWDSLVQHLHAVEEGTAFPVMPRLAARESVTGVLINTNREVTWFFMELDKWLYDPYQKYQLLEQIMMLFTSDLGKIQYNIRHLPDLTRMSGDVSIISLENESTENIEGFYELLLAFVAALWMAFSSNNLFVMDEYNRWTFPYYFYKLVNKDMLLSQFPY